ncbi:hypothetical protein VULLAG_LOCUS21175 [Vulpes lagopus]
MPSALPQSQPSLPHAPSILRPAPGSAREAQSESLSPFNRPNSNLAPARAHERPESEDLGKKRNRTPLQPPASGGREAQKPGRADPSQGHVPSSPLEPPRAPSSHRSLTARRGPAGGGLGRRAPPGPALPGTCRARPRRRRLPAAGARPPAAESAALRATRGGARARGRGGDPRLRAPAAGAQPRGSLAALQAAGARAPPAASSGSSSKVSYGPAPALALHAGRPGGGGGGGGPGLRLGEERLDWRGCDQRGPSRGSARAATPRRCVLGRELGSHVLPLRAPRCRLSPRAPAGRAKALAPSLGLGSAPRNGRLVDDVTPTLSGPTFKRLYRPPFILVTRRRI